MYISGHQVSLGALLSTNLFLLTGARPLAEDGIDVFARAPVIETVIVTVEETTTDFWFETTTIGVPAGGPPVAPPSVAPVTTPAYIPPQITSVYVPPPPPIVTTSATSTYVPPPPPEIALVDTSSIYTPPPPPPTTTSAVYVPPPVLSTSFATLPIQTTAAPPPPSPTDGSSTTGGVCTTGDEISPIGFHITNAGSVDATYYFYASIDALSTSEEVPYKCAEINSGDTIFVSIPPGLNGRINRGLPYSATSDHPSRGPASWVEFNHQVDTNTLWGDVSLIQGYDGAVTLTGNAGTYGFNQTLPMNIASQSYSAALTTKTGYPSNIPAPTVIGPTVQTDVPSNIAAYQFYSDGFPVGPCGGLQEVAYVSNDPAFNPNFQSSDDVFYVTFYDGIV